MVQYTEVRVREMTERGDWPWRFIVEGKTAPRFRKKWPWSRSKTVLVPAAWVQLRHGKRGFRACDKWDAYALADHYERAIANEPIQPFHFQRASHGIRGIEP